MKRAAGGSGGRARARTCAENGGGSVGTAEQEAGIGSQRSKDVRPASTFRV